MNLRQTTRKGFMAIITVIALLALSVSIMFATNYLSIDQSQMGLALVQGESALQLVYGCAENALLLTRRDETYTGGTIDILNGTCEVQIVKNNTLWELTITGEREHFEKTLVISLERLPGSPATITPISWREE